MAPDDSTRPHAATPEAGAAPRPSLASRYRLGAPLGNGAMAHVYRAFDSVLGREVAVKVLDPTVYTRPENRERFLREARAAASLENEHIVSVYDVDEAGGYLVMELVAGETLREVTERGPLAVARVRAIADGVLDALEAAHVAGIVHRDVKPSNIMVRTDGRPVLVDFGVARLADVTPTLTASSVVGTLAFMAPEQFRGEIVDGRADLYALGATLYLLLVGQRFDPLGTPRREQFARLRRACRDAALAAWVARALEPDPARRFENAAAARAALRRPAPLVARRRLMLAALVLLVIVSGGLAVTRLRSMPPDTRLEAARSLAQRGEPERARDLVAAYLQDHADDPDALTLQVLVVWWTHTSGAETDAVVSKALAARLTPAQRALVRGLYFLQFGREVEAIAFLREADSEHPNEPEVLYAKGEALWHGAAPAEGVAALRRAFELDPRWEMALHHVVEYHLSEGRPEELRPMLETLRRADPGSAAALESAMLVCERKYPQAAQVARTALASHADNALLWVRLSEALTLDGDLVGGEDAAREGFQRSPVDPRGEGPLSHLAEFALYRRDVEQFRRTLQNSRNMVSVLVDILWTGRTTVDVARPLDLDKRQMRGLPFWTAMYFLFAVQSGRDESAAIASYADLEVRAYGEGLLADRRGDTTAAAAAYDRGLHTPSRGDMRMLLAHHLARAKRALGDAASAAAACDEVLHPRIYQVYRAVLMPDCSRWTAEAAPDAHVKP
jgi:tRNA A-37 threonylcarbamoyl transferase component Bud32/tetratricopeptide (TPR) repeat protein